VGPKPPSVRLSPDEAWQVVASAHTGIFTTLRADGSPVALPVWFVVLDRTVCLSAPSGTKKIARVRRDPRASFLVESGERWADLVAVHLSGTAEIVDHPPTEDRIAAALDAKYDAFRAPRDKMPEETRARYAHRTFLRLSPQGRILSWENARLLEGYGS
jgi:PPOX class probable F420-dependent enzyme